jgi:hypothetical protein
VAAPGEVEASMLAGVLLVGGLDVTVTRGVDRTVITLPQAARAVFAANLPGLPLESVLALTACPSPEADGALVWSPGQAGPTAIAAPGARGERLAAAFVMFVPQQAADALLIVEDGVALTITDATWARLRGALIDGAAVTAAGVELSWT